MSSGIDFTRTLRYAVGVFAGLSIFAGGAHAQTWPAKPVKFILSTPSGTSPDLVGRMLGERLAKAFGQPFLVENIAGAGGNASLMALSRALGADSHKDGIRVVGINPGAIETDRQVVRWRARAEKELGSAERWRELVTGFPFARLGTVDEIANMVAFLCSDCSGYTTGCVITIDGGASHQK